MSDSRPPAPPTALFELGETVWISDDSQVWVLAKTNSAVQCDDSIVKAKALDPKLNGGKEVSRPVSEVHKTNAKPMPDMTSLHHINEPAIMQNLSERSGTKQPYTFMASALIAVNPLERLQEPAASDYVGVQSSNEVAPHPFCVAELAYQNMSFSKSNQSIIISGESGAGKTETAKIILKFLASRSLESQASESLDEKILRTSPILESFGNARTVRNNNSSRFGKFMKLCFKKNLTASSSSIKTTPSPKSSKNSKSGSESFHLMGALIETYLLEKSRVVRQSAGECNFHIFYQLLASPPPNLFLESSTPGCFGILTNHASEPHLFGEIKEVCSLQTITEAFHTIGLSKTEVHGIWSVLAGILHLSNVTIDERDSKEGNGLAHIRTTDASLQHASKVLQVDAQQLVDLLVQREVITRGETITIPLSRQDSVYTRDAVVKGMYEALFHLVVRLNNQSLSISNNTISANSSSSKRSGKTGVTAIPTINNNNINTININNNNSMPDTLFIGVLDIFGFENFQQNDFSQLLINYANEFLQNTFNKQIFENEVNLFIKEEIEFTLPECPNNLQCVTLLGSKVQPSVLSTLDTVSRQPKPSDDRFCEELHKLFNKQKALFPPVHRKDMRMHFQIRHYAGVVRYKVDGSTSHSNRNSVRASDLQQLNSQSIDAQKTGGMLSQNSWIVQNNDSLPEGLTALYATSQLAEMNSLMHVGAQAVAAANGRRQSFINKVTIAQSFSKSMDDLNALLLSTQCQFIRCIKPNATMTPRVFSNVYVVEQLRALGILEACEVLKVCLPTRITYYELKQALQHIITRVEHLFTPEDSEQLLISCLLITFGIPSELCKLGKTMIFFRPGQLSRLEKLLSGRHSSMTDAQIVQQLQTLLQQNRTLRGAVDDIHRRLVTLEQSVLDHEQDYDSIMIRSKDAVQKDSEQKGLEIPEDLLKKIGSVEPALEELKQLHKKASIRYLSITGIMKEYSDIVAQKQLTASLSEQSQRLNSLIEPANGHIDRGFEDYNMILVKIQELEDGDGGTLSPLFYESSQRAEGVLDYLKAQFIELNTIAIPLRQYLDKCELVRVEQSVTQLSAAFGTVDGHVSSLMEDLSVANAELDNVVGGYGYVDFTGVHRIVDTVLGYLSASKTQLNESLQLATTIDSLVESTVGKEIDKRKKQAEAAAKLAADKALEEEKLLQQQQQSKAVGDKSMNNRNSLDAATVTPTSASTSTPTPVDKKAGTVSFNIKDLLQAKRASITPSVTSGKHSEQSGLPEGWKELFDKKSQRNYYVNSITKERQWNKPVTTGTSKTKSISTNRQSWRASAADVPEESESSKKVQFNNASTSVDTDALPEGWREVLDKKSGRFFYVNDATKERQWKRPAPKRDKRSKRPDLHLQTDSLSNSIKESSFTDIVVLDEDADMRKVDRVSRRLSFDGLKRALDPTNLDTDSGSMHGISPVPVRSGTLMNSSFFDKEFDKWLNSDDQEEEAVEILTEDEFRASQISKARRQSSLFMERITEAAVSSGLVVGQTALEFEEVRQNDRSAEDKRDANQLFQNTGGMAGVLPSGRHSVQHMMILGKLDKTGYLMKQSKILGRWKKRFVTLSNGLLEYYDKESDAKSKRNGKGFQLTGQCLTSFTQTDRCFCISDSASDNSDAKNWYLMADNFKEMESWMTAINSHIHVQYVLQHHLDNDYWEDGILALSFWRVPPSALGTPRRPVGIRTLPIIDGPRTGEGVFPGEIIEVVQTIRSVNGASSRASLGSAQQFLRLADDRGWVFEVHPTGFYSIIEPCAGTVVEELRHYQYSEDCLESLDVFYNPSCDPDQRTGFSIAPGEKIYTCIEFTPTTINADVACGDGGESHSSASGKSQQPHHGGTHVKAGTSAAGGHLFGYQGYNANLVDDDGGSSGNESDDTENAIDETYLKLADGRGWINMYHPVTGGQLLTLLKQQTRRKSIVVSNDKSVAKVAPKVVPKVAPKVITTTSSSSRKLPPPPPQSKKPVKYN